MGNPQTGLNTPGANSKTFKNILFKLDSDPQTFMKNYI